MRVFRGATLFPGNNPGDLLTWDGTRWVSSPPATPTPPPSVIQEGDTIIYQTINGILYPVPASQLALPSGAQNVYQVESFAGTPDGTLLAAWPDASGNAHNLANTGGADRPAYIADPQGDGIPAVRFDGVADFMRVVGMPAVNTSEQAVFCVMSQIGPAASEPWALGRVGVADSAAGNARGTVGAASFTNGCQANNLGGATAIGAGSTALDSASSVNTSGLNVRRAFAFKWSTRRGRWSCFTFVGDTVAEAFLTVAPVGTNFVWTAVALGAGNNGGGAPNLFSACDWNFFAVYPSILADRVVWMVLAHLRARYRCL